MPSPGLDDRDRHVPARGGRCRAHRGLAPGPSRLGSDRRGRPRERQGRRGSLVLPVLGDDPPHGQVQQERPHPRSVRAEGRGIQPRLDAADRRHQEKRGGVRKDRGARAAGRGRCGAGPAEGEGDGAVLHVCARDDVLELPKPPRIAPLAFFAAEAAAAAVDPRRCSLPAPTLPGCQ